MNRRTCLLASVVLAALSSAAQSPQESHVRYDAAGNLAELDKAFPLSTMGHC